MDRPFVDFTVGLRTVTVFEGEGYDGGTGEGDTTAEAEAEAAAEAEEEASDEEGEAAELAGTPIAAVDGEVDDTKGALFAFAFA